MNTTKVVVEQTRNTMRAWKYELLELKARVAHSQDSTSGLQISRQRIIELQAQIDALQRQLSKLNA